MTKLAVPCLIASTFLLASSAGATSVSSASSQVNAPPSSGFYQLRSAQASDAGSGKFMVFWQEDTVSDIPDYTGNLVKSRGFQVSGAGFSQFKAASTVSQTVIDGLELLLGVHQTSNRDMHVLWSISKSGAFSIYKQVFRSGAKSGSIATVAGSISGIGGRYVGGRSDKVGALLWRPTAGTHQYEGNLLSGLSGATGAAIGFDLPPDDTLLRTEGVGTGFVATASTLDATFTNTKTVGRSFTSSFSLTPTVKVLQSFISDAKQPFQTIASRSDGKVVYFNGLLNTSNKTDDFAQAFTGGWGLASSKVKVESSLPAATNAPPITTRLANGGLLIGHTTPATGGFVITFRRLGANLSQVGTSAKIGPAAGLALRDLETLSTGKVIAVYSIGNKLYIRQVTP